MTPTTRGLIVAFSGAMILVSFGIGWWARRRVQSVEAYFGGTKTFGPVTVALSSTAAVASAFALVGVPGLIYATGNTISLWMLGSPAMALGALILGKKLRAMAEVGPIATLGDVSDLRFHGHRASRRPSPSCCSSAASAYLAAQIKAGAELFAHLLGVSPLAAGLGIFGILIVYTVLSGEVGGILTQAFQGLVMVVAGLILIVRFFQITGGFGPVLDAVSTAGTVTVGDLEKTFTPDAVDAWGTSPAPWAMAWVLIPIVGVICQPQVLTRMYALKDPRELANASLYGTAAHMVVAFMVLCVGSARSTWWPRAPSRPRASGPGHLRLRRLRGAGRPALRLRGGARGGDEHLEPVPLPRRRGSSPGTSRAPSACRCPARGRSPCRASPSPCWGCRPSSSRCRAETWWPSSAPSASAR
jgi:Na+/proline symporter